jgi:hypothetical protein
MIKSLEPIKSPTDWELSIINGNVTVKIKRGKTYEFSKAMALRFFEELESLLRPSLFQLEEREDGVDIGSLMDSLVTTPQLP